MSRYALVSFALLLLARAVHADGASDNVVDKVRQIPPPGVAIPDADRATLKTGVEELGKEIEALRGSLKGKTVFLELLPDVQIYHNAVRYALDHNELFNVKEVSTAALMLKAGLERAKQLREGKSPWNTATGLVVRGYVSKIDGSVQPYGLIVPASWQPGGVFHHRLDIWFHGRGENLSEINFINGRQSSVGPIAPANTFVLHPYGRFCNANKFAGEIDTLEAIEHVKKHYPIDDNRICVRGFSMGGAACWQFAVHYAGRWAAAAPGAGFSETADFLKVFQNEPVQPTWYEKKLWHMYDCTDYAVNLFNLPTVAYSGEIDKQKQAADMMAKALADEGLSMVHIIGPKTAHAYHPAAQVEINRRIDSIMAKGRNPVPEQIKFTTYTLRYNEMLWLTVDGLEQHWERARVDASMAPEPSTSKEQAAALRLTTSNVSALTLNFPAGYCPLDNTRRPLVKIDSETLSAPPVLTDRSWTASFRKADGKWQVATSPTSEGLHKQHGLQGPIDDAFMDSFVMVRPTGKPLNDKIGKWVEHELSHAVEHWRRQFRGEARIKNDDMITDEDIANNNLILWGDPGSNKVMAKIVDRLPIRWSPKVIELGKQSFSADHHVPVFIFPNPLNPKRYVVVNSGFTYREYDYLNNARQIPKLPDFAVLDVSVPVSSRSPGGIATAGFFNEHWELPAASK